MLRINLLVEWGDYGDNSWIVRKHGSERFDNGIGAVDVSLSGLPLPEYDCII